MSNFMKYNAMHFDTLREIANIGSGNAIAALGKMLGHKIRMSVPVINLVDFKDIAKFIGGAENIIIGILVGISGEINGIMMFMVKQDSAANLLDILMGSAGRAGGAERDVLNFTEVEHSALTEIGNILCSSYLGSLSSLINKRIIPSVPMLSIDMANAILSVPAIEFGKVADQALFIESVFQAETQNVSGYFLLVPDLPSFNLILSSLGVE
ncbi:MAG: chemotaxis protein CheC [Clostridiales bacterium]|jgi:chemotaxis protein CheC|nr:chemotaxis protein CheC [Clostridiales bacterium]